jgi:alpha,alpha-trehalase
LIGLPERYLAPTDGEMFTGEMYYWDSLWIARGLRGTDFERLIPGLARNLGSLMRRFGIIPNASRYYFTSRSQPPVFMALLRLAWEVLERREGREAANAFLRPMVKLAIREHHNVWMGESHPNHRKVHCGLSRYFDANYSHFAAVCESGWDHTTRFDDRCLDHLAIDLNALLHGRELDIAWALDTLGRPRAANQWRRRAELRADVINELMWDEASGFYFDSATLHQGLWPTSTFAPAGCTGSSSDSTCSSRSMPNCRSRSSADDPTVPTSEGYPRVNAFERT